MMISAAIESDSNSFIHLPALGIGHEFYKDGALK